MWPAFEVIDRKPFAISGNSTFTMLLRKPEADSAGELLAIVYSFCLPGPRQTRDEMVAELRTA
jgi:hypothetical protein